jgi:hypothetical protein
VSTWKKSTASSPSAWVRRNLRQESPVGILRLADHTNIAAGQSDACNPMPPHRRQYRERPGGNSPCWFFSLGTAIEVGEVGADGRDRGFPVVGAVDAEAGEDVQGVLPVCAGLFGLA